MPHASSSSATMASRWLTLHLRVLAVGLAAGLVAVAFHSCLDLTRGFRPWLIARAGGGWLALPASVAFSVAAVLPAVYLVARLCPEASGSGIPHVKGVMQGTERIRWLRVLPVKFAGGVLGIGGGMALGREGPTVQMGAALGELTGQSAPLTPAERKRLLALGAGAGLAGAFNSPLAGMLFIYEELGEEFHPSTATAGLLATASADAVCRLLLGQRAEFGSLALAAPPLGLLPWFLLLGVLGGLGGVAFNQSLLTLMRGAGRLRRRVGSWPLALAVAVAVGVAGWWEPAWVGGGYPLIEAGLAGKVGLGLALWLLALRFALTLGSYATGAAGGLFGPLLVLGALLGCLVGKAGPPEHQATFVVAGMAALFTGVVRAPLTGVVLLIEMADAYHLVLGLLVACLAARVVADATGDRPIYEALLHQSREPGPAGGEMAG